MTTNPVLAPLRSFIGDLAALIGTGTDEAALLVQGGTLLRDLVADDGWLPDAYAVPSPERYQQYLLHCDGAERFSVVSFVWSPGQATPIHDHTVWGLVGVLRGAELSQGFTRDSEGALRATGPAHRLNAGQVELISSALGDIHRVANAFDDRVSVSIHVYGGNIGAIRRSTYDAAGQPKPFTSGYANSELPNLWYRSDA